MDTDTSKWTSSYTSLLNSTWALRVLYTTCLSHTRSFKHCFLSFFYTSAFYLAFTLPWMHRRATWAWFLDKDIWHPDQPIHIDADALGSLCSGCHGRHLFASSLNTGIGRWISELCISCQSICNSSSLKVRYQSGAVGLRRRSVSDHG